MICGGEDGCNPSGYTASTHFPSGDREAEVAVLLFRINTSEHFLPKRISTYKNVPTATYILQGEFGRITR
jgi:hypothetical protein